MRSVAVSKVALFFAIALALIAAAFTGVRAYMNNPNRDTPIVYSKNAMLLELWNDYKTSNIEPNTYRTLDKQQNNITTSEGQSYTMLRAVWSDDRTTFDKSWQWTKDNLQRDDKLMSWKFGQKPDGNYGIQETVGGQNTASDGDSDIALALLMAYSRWNESAYLYDAKPIITAMWQKEVVTINGKPVLASNDLERNDPNKIVVNPSYFAPYAYKEFAKVDKSHDWNGLATNSYDLLQQLSSNKLDKSYAVGLPPDWIAINRKTGAFEPAQPSSLTTNYGYDAMRIPWRMALDYQWNKDERAKQVLQKMSFLDDQWTKEHKLHTTYSHDGMPVGNYESPAAYGTAIGYFKVIMPDTAQQVFSEKLQPLYDPNEQRWKTEQQYYDDNWAWFGMALMQNALPNLTKTS